MLVILIGIVVNNGIVLVDHIGQRRRGGLDAREALLQACGDRLRPILMTAATTVLGLLPMAIGSGEGAELRDALVGTEAGVAGQEAIDLGAVELADRVAGELTVARREVGGGHLLLEDVAIEPAVVVLDSVPVLMQRADVPGLQLAFVESGEIIATASFGYADSAHVVPVTDATVFEAASLSKPVFAYAVLRMVDRGEWDLDQPLWDILEYERLAHDDRAKELTTRHVLTHTTGLPNWGGTPLEFNAAPGERWGYSGEGFVYLQRAVETQTGLTLEQIGMQEVFEPLGLRNTVADHTDSIVTFRTSFYEQGEDGTVLNAPYVDNSYKWAGGGFLSTPEDMVRFGQQHLGEGFLRAETLAELQTPQTLANGESTGYGIGWSSDEQDDGDRTYAHSGGSVGGATLLLLVPEHDLVVAGVVNISGPASRIVQRVAQVFEDHLEDLE